MAEVKPATLDGYSGSGFAEVTQDPGPTTRKSCNGVFYFSNPADSMRAAVENKTQSTFSGSVFERGQESHLTFPVIITQVTAGGSRAQATFTATGNQYQGAKDS